MASRSKANGEQDASHDPQGGATAAAAARRRLAWVTARAGRRWRGPARTRLVRLVLLLLLVSLWTAAGTAYRGQPQLVTAAPARGATPTPVELRAVTARATSAAHPPVAAAGVRPPPPTAASRELPQPPPSQQPPAPASTPRGFTLLASGDVLAHRSVQQRARAYGLASGRPYDFRPMFAAIRPIVSAADLAVCHLETPLSPSGRDLSGYPRFNVPPQLATALRGAGYDACSVASNHAMDQGVRGVAGTLAVLDRAGLRHAGTARSPREARPRILTVAGVRVALLSYAYGLNGLRLPRGRPWLVNLLHPSRILADARAARRAGSQFTVVFLHWGQEYRSAPTPAQRSLAAKLLADPSVDLIVGHHAHVVQPVQRRHGKWVAFGMGNSLSAQSAACCPAATQDGVLLQVTVVRRAGRYVVGKVRYTPTWVEHPSYRILPVPGALARGSASPAVRAMLRASLHRTTAAVGPAARLATRP
jgi:poly-gamma-glutamate synthesis protein (capsule biosynthesis protein)